MTLSFEQQLLKSEFTFRLVFFWTAARGRTARVPPRLAVRSFLARARRAARSTPRGSGTRAILLLLAGVQNRVERCVRPRALCLSIDGAASQRLRAIRNKGKHIHIAFYHEATAGFAVHAVNVRCNTPGALFKGAPTALWRLGPSVIREERWRCCARGFRPEI